MTNDSNDYDQDSEPTMNAPEEGRPDGLEALKDDADTGATQPQHSDAEVLESQEEEQPPDE
ncbi:MAG TPA: hypothetical protein VJN29_17540 [Intrasporangium sp.]|uniref:hypothetical protein n=1 Tax=Intrasporangium sp. TaxID=1925024 RepID=UPI002B468461|nr:hypothetical protein [Intrasporangium sp.]HKX69022.1 hypothetical protein [Intrasporangium sp.]